jgi:hypothetical protein
MLSSCLFNWIYLPLLQTISADILPCPSNRQESLCIYRQDSPLFPVHSSDSAEGGTEIQRAPWQSLAGAKPSDSNYGFCIVRNRSLLLDDFSNRGTEAKFLCKFTNAKKICTTNYFYVTYKNLVHCF